MSLRSVEGECFVSLGNGQQWRMGLQPSKFATAMLSSFMPKHGKISSPEHTRGIIVTCIHTNQHIIGKPGQYVYTDQCM